MDPMDVDGAPVLRRRLVPQNEPSLLVKQLSAEVCPGDQPPATVPEAVFVTHSRSDVPVQVPDVDLPDYVHFCSVCYSCLLLQGTYTSRQAQEAH